MVGYDSEMDLDSSQEAEDRHTVKRKSSQVNMLHSEKLHVSKKFMTKKHPSPSKDDLDVMGLQLGRFMTTSQSVPILQRDNTSSLSVDHMAKNACESAEEPPRTTPRALSPKRTNKLIKRASGVARQFQTVSVPEKLELSTTTSMPLLSFPTRPRHPKNSMLPQSVSRNEGSRGSDTIQEDSSMLGLDELQWDKAVYDIGMRRA